MLKRQINPNEQYEILKSTHIIGVLSQLIQVEHQNRIFDIKFKLPNTNNHSKRIKESAEAISKDISLQFKVKDREFMNYEYCMEMWRLVDHFSELGVDKIREFMDGVDEIKEGRNA